MKALLILLALCWIASAEAKPKQKPQKHKHKMALKDSLAAYWDFEQDPVIYPPIWDQTHNGNHLTPTPIGSGAALVEGKIGNAVHVGGTSRLILSSNVGVSHQGNPFTVAFWFKPTVLATPLVIAGDPEGQWLVQMEQSGADFYLRARVNPDDIDATMNVTAVPMVIGEWYWVTLGWYDDNGSYAWASVNLSVRVRTAAEGPLAEPTNPPIFWNSNVFDEAAIWRRNVPAHELYRIYNDGDGLPFEKWDAATPCAAIDCCD